MKCSQMQSLIQDVKRAMGIVDELQAHLDNVLGKPKSTKQEIIDATNMLNKAKLALQLMLKQLVLLIKKCRRSLFTTV